MIGTSKTAMMTSNSFIEDKVQQVRTGLSFAQGRRRFIKPIVSLTLIIVVGIVGCREASQEAVIEGGSMAPALYGRHFRIQCDDCGFPFKVDTKIPKQKTFACPNCGFTENPVPPSVSNPDRVEIEPAVLLARWDLVALKRKSEEYNVVKRLVGLPGEKIEIKGGDIFVDGERVKKNISEQKRMRILVHDSGYIPKSELESPWRAVTSESGWKVGKSGMQFESPAAHNGDWLKYHHRRGFHHLGKRLDEFPVEDSYAFNQAISRSLVPCNDLYLEIDLASTLESDIKLRYVCGTETYDLDLAMNGSRAESLKFTSAQKMSQSASYAESIRSIGVTSIDNEFRLTLNDGESGWWELNEPDSQAEPTQNAFHIRCLGDSLDIARIRIYRDIYYRDLVDSPAGGYQLDEDEYFFLGDNVPVSVDSRQWSENDSVIEVLGRVRSSGPLGSQRR